MKELLGHDVRLREGDLIRRERTNREYLMKLKSRHLLRNYELEAGRYSGRGHDHEAFGGWEDPSCQLRGHFLGHWLSAAALNYQETSDVELLAKTQVIIDGLELCQRDNGGEWACPIPEKYLYWIGEGKGVWAPQYNIHKLFMGLVDVYKIMKIEKALTIADKLADWFYRWSGEYSRQQFDNILDNETGGMLEVWADLLEITGDEKYRELLARYYRGRLFDPLLEGKDVLTNMHANTTIPEVLGCARAYEVTGDEKWLRIVEAYWKCAVTDRGCFVTGGQTQGEIWTPMKKLKARLGDKNQEHCTVYNMIRLAEFLFRQTKDPEYMHYIEYNVQNGLLAQAHHHGAPYKGSPWTGLLTYFLPMKAGSKKDWAGETDSFFCCHGTMVQANAAWNRHIYYVDDNELYITMFTGSEASVEIGGKSLRVSLHQDHMNGSLMTSSENNALQTINETTRAYANKPDFRKYVITVHTEEPVSFALKLRIPDWITKPATISVNDGEGIMVENTAEFVTLEREWRGGDRVVVLLPIGVKFITLPDDDTMGAFRYGPDVLAGITEQERILYIEGDKPEDELTADTEREWGSFRTFYRTENQDPGINFKKLNEIGYEPYQIYFKVKKK
ncbi:MAG: glycoside hydrolase family 127 protein [Oscillospiraceae bacterium]|nr:glycoside hydrolase family 127 protein [Oscillospiraceae bacterium]